MKEGKIIKIVNTANSYLPDRLKNCLGIIHSNKETVSFNALNRKGIVLFKLFHIDADRHMSFFWVYEKDCIII